MNRIGKVILNARNVRGEAIDKWESMESASIALTLVGVGLLSISAWASALVVQAAVLGCLSGAAVLSIGYFRIAQSDRGVTVSTWLFVVFLATTVAILENYPLWVIFCNGFGGLLFSVGGVCFFTKSRFR